MTEYMAVAAYSNRAGDRMECGWFRSRARAEEAAVAMTSKGYEKVKIYSRQAAEDEKEN